MAVSRDNFQPEVVSDVIPCPSVTVEWADLDVRMKLGDCRPNRYRDIRAVHFVIDDDERRSSSHKAECPNS